MKCSAALLLALPGLLAPALAAPSHYQKWYKECLAGNAFDQLIGGTSFVECGAPPPVSPSAVPSRTALTQVLPSPTLNAVAVPKRSPASISAVDVLSTIYDQVTDFTSGINATVLAYRVLSSPEDKSAAEAHLVNILKKGTDMFDLALQDADQIFQDFNKDQEDKSMIFDRIAAIVNELTGTFNQAVEVVPLRVVSHVLPMLISTLLTRAGDMVKPLMQQLQLPDDVMESTGHIVDGAVELFKSLTALRR